MPVRKFRDVSEIPDPWREPGSSEHIRAMRNVWDFAERTTEPRFPPGVYKHRSIEDAKKLKEVWQQANFEAYQERQRALREKRQSASGR